MRGPWRAGLLRLAGLVVLGGCASAATAPAPTAVSPPLDAPASLAPDFIVWTRDDPPRELRVEGARVVLTGEQGARVLSVVSNAALFDGRQVVATDAQGQVEVRVTPRACEEAVSGAWLDYTARVTVDGGTPVMGCGRAP